MNTFDVFDTLIARRYITTHEVWRRLEVEFDLPNFVNTRQIPDDGSRSFKQIYDMLVQQGIVPAHLRDAIHDREIALEIETTFPVQENMDKVQDGDLLISDMYLPPEVILQMVRCSGLEKQVTIYQSNADKGNGSVWVDLIKSPPGYHIGDNPHTDYSSPNAAGINGVLYPGTAFTQPESFLDSVGLRHLALLTREIRLGESEHDDYFNVANQINLPLLFVVIEQLRRSIGNTPITFLGRDCHLMWKLYLEYFGVAYYMPFSRKIAYAQPELAARYIKSHSPADTVIVDISSTGETWKHMSRYGIFNVKSVIYSDSKDRNLPDTFSYLTKNSVCGETNLILEIMNCADHGYVDSLTAIGNKLIKANYAKKELPDAIINAVQSPVSRAIELSKFYKTEICAELNIRSDAELATLFDQLSSTICQQDYLLEDLIEFNEKETEYHEQIIAARELINNE
jgi:hypothetical protein